MNATAKRKEMKQHQMYIESAGYEVRMLKDGTLEVKDPAAAIGNDNASAGTVKLSSPLQAIRFIKDRS